MPELELTGPAALEFSVVVDMFNAATAPGAVFSSSFTLGDGGGGFSGFFGGGGAAAAADGGAAPSGGDSGGAAAPTPSAD